MKELVPNLLDSKYEPKATISDMERLIANPAWQDIVDFIEGHIYKLRDCLELDNYTHPDLSTAEKVRGALYIYRLMLKTPVDFIEDIKSAQKIGEQEDVRE